MRHSFSSLLLKFLTMSLLFLGCTTGKPPPQNEADTVTPLEEQEIDTWREEFRSKN